MASNTTNRSFTITQAFLGAPLHFQPALGSQGLEDLIEVYVPGSASKQNKLSDVTIDFYNNATVDLNTGALTRTYEVFPQWSATSFLQSPVSQTAGLSPMFTTSPGSSTNLNDSGYGSFSMTPPTNSRGRVTKKAKKDTKKESEIRLPGFSIMTKDGVDVTSSAGRGTKTKEQREHAHLMRIMKACPDCKKKKVRCDPSHRRSQDMSRTSTSTTKSSSSSVSPSQPRPSPPMSHPSGTVPSFTPEASFASSSTPSFSPSNAIDDFVLFPEDAWNSDMSLAGLETEDLGQFNFDINALDESPQHNNQPFDFQFDSQFSNFDFNNNLRHTPAMTDQYGLDQWASPLGGQMGPVHTRPHPASTSQDYLDANFFSSDWQQNISSLSPTTNALAPDDFAYGSMSGIQSLQTTASNDSSPVSSASDWSMLEAGVIATPSSSPDANTPASQSSSENVRQNRKRRASDANVIESTLPLANQPGSGSGIDVDPSDVPKSGGFVQSSQPALSRQPLSPRNVVLVQSPSEVGLLSPSSSSDVSSIAAFANICQSTIDAIARIKAAPAEAHALSTELGRLQSVLLQVQSGGSAVGFSSFARQVQALSSRLQTVIPSGSDSQLSPPSHERYEALESELRADYLRQCQIQARRIVRSLCATINNVQAQNNGTSSTTDGPMLTSGRNVHLFAPKSSSQIVQASPSFGAGVQMWVESTHPWQFSSSRIGSTMDGTPDGSRVDRAIIANNSSNDVARTGYGLAPVASIADAAVYADYPYGSNVAHYHEQPLASSQVQDGSEPRRTSASDGVIPYAPVHRCRSYAHAETIPLQEPVASINAGDSLEGPSSIVPGRPLVTQSTTSNAAATLSLAQYVQDGAMVRAGASPSLPDYSESGTTVASQRALAAFQLVLPLLATLFAAYIASSNGAYMSLSPCLQYFFIPIALSYLLPASTSMISSSINFTSMIVAALASTPLMNNLAYLQQSSSRWVGTDPIVATVKLALCAVITAQLPQVLRHLDSTRLGLAAMSLLSQFDSMGCQGSGRLNWQPFDEGRYSDVRREGSSMGSWLAAMREMSPVGIF